MTALFSDNQFQEVVNVNLALIHTTGSTEEEAPKSYSIEPVRQLTWKAE